MQLKKAKVSERIYFHNFDNINRFFALFFNCEEGQFRPGGISMIYEAAVVTRAELSEDNIKKIQGLTESTVGEFGGEILINDDWGVRRFGQPSSRRIEKGHYLYFVYRSDIEKGNVNKELERKFKIHEDVINYMTLKLGDDDRSEQIKKDYANPFN